MDTLFSQRFVKEKTPTGKYTYHFIVAGTGVAIEGATIGPDIPKGKTPRHCLGYARLLPQ